MSWQPIETAPKDGTLVLLYDGSPWPSLGSWRRDYYREDLGEMWLDDSNDEYSLGCASLRLNPSHWMPIPPPPEQ